MYNPATQVQVPTDGNLGSYLKKIKIGCRGFPYHISFQKKDPFYPERRMRQDLSEGESNHTGKTRSHL
jgi:hypothetical protein